MALKCLHLDSHHITDAGLKELRRFGSLWMLSLPSQALTDAGLLELKRLQHLESLLILGGFTDADLEKVKNELPRVEVHSIDLELRSAVQK